MPLSSSIVGRGASSVSHEIDARWVMAYSAGLGDDAPCYRDTLAGQDLVAHPLFPVCVEWPAILASRDLLAQAGMSDAERLRGVHATHDLRIHRLVRPGDRLTTTARIVGVERRKPGAYMTTRLETTDAEGQPVATTLQGSLFLDVDLEGKPQPFDAAPQDDPPGPNLESVVPSIAIPIAANAAHVYTECARIWNPIHTDRAVARRAGLPDIILHGTATLALAVSRLVETYAGGDPRRVRRLTCRFAAMVPMPSRIELKVSSARNGKSGETLRFEVLNAEGKPAIRDGSIQIEN